MADTYTFQPPGRYAFAGIILACTQCSADLGLTFTTAGTVVTASCSCGHSWREDRVPASGIRDAVYESQRGSRL